jgi:hypothetical protein
MEGCYKLDMSKFGAWFAECLESRNGNIQGLVADEDTITEENVMTLLLSLKQNA